MIKDWTDLTEGEKNLVMVMMDVEHVGKSISAKCRLAGVTRTIYYHAMKKPGFAEFLNAKVEKMIQDHLYEVTQATFKYALTERGHQDRKMIMQMYGKLIDQVSVRLPQFIEDVPEDDD